MTETSPSDRGMAPPDRRGTRAAAVAIRRAAVAVLAAAAAWPAVAPADTGRMVDFTLGLSSTTPASPTGLTLHFLFKNPQDANAKPAPLRGAVITGPAGLRFDSRAAPECSAADAQIHAQGSDACPADSQVALGSFSAISGFGPPADPFLGDDHVFNGAQQLIEIITLRGQTASPGFDRVTISGATLTAHPPVTPGGPPDGETAIRSIDFQIPVHATGGRSLITTPGECPPSGVWQSSGAFTFANGQSETVSSRTPCTSPKSHSPPSGSGQQPSANSLPGCTSRRRPSIRVPGGQGARVQRVELVVDGRLVRTFPRGTRRVPVDLRGTPKRAVHVRVIARAVGGRRLVSEHTFHTCTHRAPH